MKYKIGDKVFIKSNLKMGLQKGTTHHYMISNRETDVRGHIVEITNIYDDHFDVVGYKSLYYDMIDLEKTNQIVNDYYEVY